MNKSELVDAVHSAAGGVDKKDVAAVVDSLIEVVQSAVARDDKVTVPGFGAWSRTQRAARTGEPVQIAASKGVKFSAGAGFKSAVNK